MVKNSLFQKDGSKHGCIMVTYWSTYPMNISNQKEDTWIWVDIPQRFD